MSLDTGGFRAASCPFVHVGGFSTAVGPPVAVARAVLSCPWMLARRSRLGSQAEEPRPPGLPRCVLTLFFFFASRLSEFVAEVCPGMDARFGRSAHDVPCTQNAEPCEP